LFLTILIRAIEHTLLVTEDGVEVLTARLPDSPGGAVSMPSASINGVNGVNGEEKPEVKAAE
jgi:methionyl aminopeptidase